MNDYKLIKQTNKGEIKIYDTVLYGKIAVCKIHIGYNLCSRYAQKNGAYIPNYRMMDFLLQYKPLDKMSVAKTSIDTY